MILAIDFDNVIHDKKHPVKKMGPPMEGALEALEDLYQLHTVIIHTTMANTLSGLKAVKDWLEYFGVEYHDIVPKVHADLYIDDRALKHIDWKKTSAVLGLD